MPKDDELRLGLAMLSALRDNVPEKDHTLGSEFVDLYHAGLDHIEASGKDSTECRIPAGWVKRRVVSTNMYSGKSSYSDGARVDTKPFLAKLDAILLLFELEGKGPIGFKGPDKKP